MPLRDLTAHLIQLKGAADTHAEIPGSRRDAQEHERDCGELKESLTHPIILRGRMSRCVHGIGGTHRA
jgi:hypothetical protein